MADKFRDETLPLEERIDALIAALSIEEKVSQLTDSAAALSRLGINRYNWWNEALHGVARAGTATVFPQAIALAAMWNEELLFQIAQAISEEARAKFNEAQRRNVYDRYYGLTFWSPNVNIFRDPRWGRGHETYGEDPYLTSKLGVAFVRGLQDGDGKHLKAAACAKHFFAHSGPEGTRHGFNTEVTEKDLFETYLPAFEACVKEGNVEAVMGAYNALNGVPCCCNGWLLNDLLRKKWGFEGHVVSDCGAVFDISAHHEYTESLVESAAAAVKNGCDLNCGDVYKLLTEAYEEDLVTEDDLDTALRHTLRARFKLGMFDEKTNYDDIPFNKVACEEHKKLCLQAAKECLVLLKNDGILPLDKSSFKSIALIGPNAASENVLLGNYNGIPTHYSTMLKGFSEYLAGSTEVKFGQGCGFFGDDDDALLKEAAELARNSDATVLCIGLDASFEGEAGDANNPFGSGDRPDIEMTASQLHLLQKICETTDKVIVVMLCGSAVAMNYADEHANAIIQGWYPGELGGQAVAEAVFGEFSPGGKLPVTFYQSTEDLPDFSDYSMANRTYRYFTGTPLYPFGFGLSYSKIEIGNLTTGESGFGGKDTAVFRISAVNTGEREGDEVLQLYVKEKGVYNQPVHSLKRFKKIRLKPGETTIVEFTLNAGDFEHVNEDGEKELAPGTEFEVFVGSCQPDARSKMLTGSKPERATVHYLG